MAAATSGLARRALVLGVALAAWACATPVPLPEARDTGFLFLWEVEGDAGAGTAHLFGSVHLARPDLRFDPAVEAAFTEAAALVVELDLRNLTPAESAALVLQHGQLPLDQSLDQLVSAEAWAAFSDLVERHGQSAAFYRGFEPWVAMVTAMALLASEKDLDGESGVDRALLERAGDREVIELETVAFQLSLFDDLPMDQQVLMLETVVLQADASRDSVGLVYDAWRLGDTELMESMLLQEGDPTLTAIQQKIFADRNRSMVERIDALLRETDDTRRYFVVVGAGHMVGASGIPALLTERGYRVQRVERSR